MRKLHDFDYRDLADCMYNLHRDFEEYHVLCDLINGENRREGVVCFANDLFYSFSQHVEELSMTFSRINRESVLPEGGEVFNSPRVVSSKKETA